MPSHPNMNEHTLVSGQRDTSVTRHLKYDVVHPPVLMLYAIVDMVHGRLWHGHLKDGRRRRAMRLKVWHLRRLPYQSINQSL